MNILKTKTFWAGIAGLVLALQGYFGGDLSYGEAIQTGIMSLIGIFLRDGVGKINRGI